MAEWYRASASGSVDLGFDSESGQTNDFKSWYLQLPCLTFSIQGTVRRKPASLLVVPLEKALNGIPPS